MSLLEVKMTRAQWETVAFQYEHQMVGMKKYADIIRAHLAATSAKTLSVNFGLDIHTRRGRDDNNVPVRSGP